MITLCKLDLSSEQSISYVECLFIVCLSIDQKNTVIFRFSLSRKPIELEVDLKVIIRVGRKDHHAFV